MNFKSPLLGYLAAGAGLVGCHTATDNAMAYDDVFSNGLSANCFLAVAVAAPGDNPGRYDMIFTKTGNASDALAMTGYYAIQFEDSNHDFFLDPTEARSLAAIEIYGDTTASAEVEGDEPFASGFGINSVDVIHHLRRIPHIRRYAPEQLDSDLLDSDADDQTKIDTINDMLFDGEPVLQAKSFERQPVWIVSHKTKAPQIL